MERAMLSIRRKEYVKRTSKKNWKKKLICNRICKKTKVEVCVTCGSIKDDRWTYEQHFSLRGTKREEKEDRWVDWIMA